MDIQLISDCKPYLDEIKSFKTRVSLIAPNNSPWDYQEFLYLNEILITKIQEIFEELHMESSPLSIDLLDRAHWIQIDPHLCTQEDTVFTHRKATVKAGESVCHAFEALCQTLWRAYMEIKTKSFLEGAFQRKLSVLHPTWSSFAHLLNKDRVDAEAYLQRSKQPHQRLLDCCDR